VTSPRALWALVGATASACSLAIGDIELPAARPPVTDAAADASRCSLPAASAAAIVASLRAARAALRAAKAVC
jgi:hypothetical protein